MLKCSHQIIPAPSSFHLPLFSLHPLFHTMSISMCKGHPGNREAAVDREINKQKKREEDGMREGGSKDGEGGWGMRAVGVGCQSGGGGG